MDTIQYKTDGDFPFENLSLITPKPMQGGSFFSKIIFKDGKSLLFQTPLCLTKNGIIKTDKKIYCDLLFSEIHESFIQWFEKLENTSNLDNIIDAVKIDEDRLIIYSQISLSSIEENVLKSINTASASCNDVILVNCRKLKPLL